MAKKAGPNRSCLIPFTDQIFHAWFQERKTAKEIQTMLAAEGVNVTASTIFRFIKVRVNKDTPIKCTPPPVQKIVKIFCDCPHCGKKLSIEITGA